MALWFILTLIVWNLFDPATALNCYSCTAALGKNLKCENLANGGGAEVPSFTCTYDDAVCAKYVIEYGDSVMIHRSCQHKNVCSVLGQKYNNFYSKIVECETCWNKDHCNSSDSPKIFPVLIGTVLLMSKVFN